MSTSEGAEVSATELDPKEEGVVVSEAVQGSTEGVGVVEAGALVRENGNEEVVDCGVEERVGRGELEVIVGRDVKEREIQEGDASRKDCEEEADGSVEVLEDTEDREVVEEEGVGAGEADGSVEEREGVEGVNGGEIQKDQMENTGDSATEGGYEEVVDKGVSVVNNVSDGNVVVEGGDVGVGEQERIGGSNVSVNDCEEEREGTEGVDGSEVREDQAGNTDADAIERGSKEHLDVGPMGQDHVGDDGGSDKGFSVLNNGSVGDAVSENGMNGGGDSNGQLLQLVNELRSQNELLKSQLESLQRSELKVEAKAAGDEGEESEDVKQLREKIKNLNRELLEERQTRSAAEEALKHLREEYFDADARAQDLSAKLAEAQQNLEREINEREVKLDTKLQRLHKRAKQRIQEIQKEKDDLEARFRDANESAERASSQQSSLQEQLERTRQQANEALKAMDADRQQMRSANNKLRDTIEELRRSLQPKENMIETLQQSLLEKEQMLKEMRGLLQTAEEKRQASLADISAKHQKNLGSLQSQLADAMSDRNKATETISSLQVLLAEKESKIAEMEAASSGEAVRLKAAVESIKGELTHLKSEHEKEKESLEAATQSLRAKLELAESNCIRAEIEAAKMRSQLDLDVSVQTQMLNTKDAEIKAATEEINRLEKEFSSYKARAHALLQKKDVELAAVKDSEQLNALESALKEAEEELSVTSMERDKALKDLQDTSAKYGKEISKR